MVIWLQNGEGTETDIGPFRELHQWDFTLALHVRLPWTDGRVLNLCVCVCVCVGGREEEGCVHSQGG